MWGYLVLGIIIGMLILVFFYCIWSFVDDCHTTQNTVQRLNYRTDDLRNDLTRLENQVYFLKKHVKEVKAHAHSGADASGYSDAVPEQSNVAEESPDDA